MAYTPRKPSEVAVWEHAVKRWCERIETGLEWENPADYATAEQHIKEFFQRHAEFLEILENGRFLFASLSDSLDVYFVVEGKDVVTVWDRHPVNEHLEELMELSRWKEREHQKAMERLYGNRRSRRQSLYSH